MSSTSFWRLPHAIEHWGQWLQPSHWLAQGCLWLPFGDSTFRAHLPGAFLVGIVGWLVFQLTCWLLREDTSRGAESVNLRPYSQGVRPAVNQALACVASLAATCSLAWIGEGALNISSCVSATLTLTALYLTQHFKKYPLIICLLALSLEAPVLLLFLCLVFFLSLKANDYWPELKQSHQVTVHLGSLLALSVLAFALSWPQLTSWIDAEPQQENYSFAAWLASPGLLWGCCALAYVIQRFFRGPRLKEVFLVAALTLSALDLFVPFNEPLSWLESRKENSTRIALHLLAIACLMPLALAGLRAISSKILDLGFIGARPIVALFLLMAATGTLASAEDTHQHLQLWNVSTSTRFSRVALLSLPPHSLIIAEKSSLTLKLQSAQRSGLRPDILIVPTFALGNAKEAARLLEAEPALATLVREYSVRGKPTEEALDLLASVRPVAVTPNQHWDRRLLEHLRPRFLIPLFSKHALGRSDRRAAIAELARPVQSLWSDTAKVSDSATRSVLRETIEDLESCMLAISDRSAAAQLRKLLGESDESRAE